MPPPPKSELKRYVAFFRHVGKTGRVWMLQDGENLALGIDKKSGMTFVPVWPTNHAAKACVRGAWSRCKPVAVEAGRLLEQWKPEQMIAQKRVVAVFPTADDDGFLVNARLFHAELGYAISRDRR